MNEGLWLRVLEYFERTHKETARRVMGDLLYELGDRYGVEWLESLRAEIDDAVRILWIEEE